MVPFILYSMTCLVEKLSYFSNIRVPVNVTFLLFASALLISGCSPAPESITHSQDNANAKLNNTSTKFNDVTITFSVHFQGLPIQCDQSLNIQNEQWQISELAMFFSQFSLNNVRPIILDDNDWQSQQIALIRYAPGCKKTTGNMSVVAAIENIDSKTPLTLSFNVGVPFAVNHQNPLIQASPLNDSSMFWAWRNGYKFIRWDMQNDMGDSWSFHLGSVGCESAAMVRAPKRPCAQSNLIPVEIVLSSDSIQVLDVPQKKDVVQSGVKMKQIHINISIHLDEIIRNMLPTRKSSCMFSGIDNTTCNELVENLKLNAVFN
jgi:uncharacterized repeat protein (TIGR04052 family)